MDKTSTLICSLRLEKPLLLLSVLAKLVEAEKIGSYVPVKRAETICPTLAKDLISENRLAHCPLAQCQLWSLSRYERRYFAFGGQRC